MYSTIVVGTDGSPTAKQAFGHALELAQMTSAMLHIVSAYHPIGRSAPVGTAAEQWALHPRAEVDGILEDAAATARSSGLKVETHASQKDPAEAVVSVAKSVRADAVVVGNKGMKGAKRFLLGSVPSKIAHNAPCTVIIVKTA